MCAARLLIAWHSVTGATEALARAAADAAQAAVADGTPVEVRLHRAGDVGVDDVLQADGLLVCTPEMLGSMAGAMKDLFDRCYYAALERTAGRPCGLIVAAGSDGAGAVRQFERFATGLRWRLVAPPLIVCTHAQTPESILAPKVVPQAELDRARELGAALAAGLGMGLW